MTHKALLFTITQNVGFTSLKMPSSAMNPTAIQYMCRWMPALIYCECIIFSEFSESHLKSFSLTAYPCVEFLLEQQQGPFLEH